MVVDTLKKLPFMQMMDERLLHELAKCFSATKYAKGALIKNDATSRFFVVVAEGSVDISTMLPKPSSSQLASELLCQRKAGDYISYVGREQLVVQMMGDDSDDAPRTAKEARKKLAALLELNRTTADPFVGCTLLKLNFDKFSKLRSRLTVHTVGMKNTARFSGGRKGKTAMGSMTAPEKLHLMGSIVESEVVNYLVEIPFLERVKMTHLVVLANMCSYLFVKRGESVCVEGEIGDKFFVCIKGTLQATLQVSLNAAQPTFTAVTPEGVGQRQRTSVVALQETVAGAFGDKKIQALKRMGTGSYFGEISLVFKIPRVCSITALDDALLVYVDRTAFCNFLKIAPDAAVVLLEHVRLNFMDTLIKQGCAFLNAIPPLKLQELSYMSEIVDYEYDTMIMRRGDQQTAFYVLVRGVVEVDYGNTDTNENDDCPSDGPDDRSNELVLVHPGGYFGQEALLLNSGSFVDVRCLDHCLVLKLMPENFHEFFATLPELFAEFCIKCLREKARPDHIMQHYEGHKLWASDCVTRLRHHEVALFEYIEDFKWEADISEDRLHERALVIYLKFLADTATTPVNISPGVLAAVEDELSSDGVGRDVFAAVREEILDAMDDESFRAFKMSRVFQEFLTTLHCPRAVFDCLTPELEDILNMRAPSPIGIRRFTEQHGSQSAKSSIPPPKRAFGSVLSGRTVDRFRRNSATVFAVANSMGTYDKPNLTAISCVDMLKWFFGCKSPVEADTTAMHRLQQVHSTSASHFGTMEATASTLNAKQRRKLLRQQQRQQAEAPDAKQQAADIKEEAADVKHEAVNVKEEPVQVELHAANEASIKDVSAQLNTKERRRLARLAKTKAEVVTEGDEPKEPEAAPTGTGATDAGDDQKLNAQQRRLLKRQAKRKAEGVEETKPPEKKKQKTKKKGNKEDENQKSIHLTLFVGQLPFRATEESIRKHFAEAGEIKLRMLTDKKTKKFKGTAFIEVKDSKALGAALSRHHTLLQGRRINVEMTASGGGNKSENRRNKIDQHRKKQSDMQVEKTKALIQKHIDGREYKLQKDDVDDRMIDFLSWFDYETAKKALEEYNRCVSDRVNNRKAFFMGILKRFRETDGAE
ncbi:unnamed protein product [Phytophthora fragariaefolia]|uniref:Unnamed protein product n=1 Tax=Phytophthora fragariaefolia TaxID=1490495 RepID=A0A9W7D6L6_9STRA|nr:unnamed protein product [Phytophthora fragariaefolia]